MRSIASPFRKSSRPPLALKGVRSLVVAEVMKAVLVVVYISRLGRSTQSR
jgi:hypothetical protein